MFPNPFALALLVFFSNTVYVKVRLSSINERILVLANLTPYRSLHGLVLLVRLCVYKVSPPSFMFTAFICRVFFGGSSFCFVIHLATSLVFVRPVKRCIILRYIGILLVPYYLHCAMYIGCLFF